MLLLSSLAAMCAFAGCTDARYVDVPAACEDWCAVARVELGGRQMRAIWSAGDRLWVVGARGAALHFDGAAWRLSEPTQHDLNAVAGDADGNVFAVGDAGTLLTWDGAQFLPMMTGKDRSATDFTGLAIADGALWVVAQDPGDPERTSVLFRDPEGTWFDTWPETISKRHGYLTAVCSYLGGEAIFIGAAGQRPDPLVLRGRERLAVLRLDFTTLPGACARTSDTVAIAEIDGSAVWLIGPAGIRRVEPRCAEGGCEAPFDTGATPAIWLADPDHGVIVADAIVRFDGMDYQVAPVASTLKAVHGTGVSDVFAVGAEGLVMQGRGEVWEPVGVGVRVDLNAVRVTSRRIVVAGDDGTILVKSRDGV